MKKNDPWTENDEVNYDSKKIECPINSDSEQDQPVLCKCCGEENIGKYYKYHIGRRLSEGEDHLEDQAYRDITYIGGNSVTTFFLKLGEGQEFICNECYQNELNNGHHLVKEAVGELMAIELSGDRDKYESCIPDYYFKHFVKPGSSCFIATACYGDSDCEEVRVFRKFRDTVLLRCNIGKKIVLLYYRISPSIAAWILGYNMRRYIIKYTLLVPALVLSRATIFILGIVRKSDG